MFRVAQVLGIVGSVLVLSCRSSDVDRPYFNALRDCLIERGVQVEAAERTELRRALTACEEQLGPMPVSSTPYSEFDVSDPAVFEHGGEVFLAVLERCLDGGGYSARIIRQPGVYEVDSQGRIPFDVLKRCTSTASQAEIAIVRPAG